MLQEPSYRDSTPHYTFSFDLFLVLGQKKMYPCVCAKPIMVFDQIHEVYICLQESINLEFVLDHIVVLGLVFGYLTQSQLNNRSMSNDTYNLESQYISVNLP